MQIVLMLDQHPQIKYEEFVQDNIFVKEVLIQKQFDLINMYEIEEHQ